MEHYMVLPHQTWRTADKAKPLELVTRGARFQ